MTTPSKHIFLSLARIALGWIFLWAFLDKLFGLGFATTPEKAWLKGGSPTAGFLKAAVHGPMAGLFHSLAGNVVVDWLFMLGLGLIGLSLILGIGLKIAGYSGALLMLLIWSTMLPPQQNPLVDEHIVYIFLLLGIAQLQASDQLGLGKWWSQTALVQRYKWLR